MSLVFYACASLQSLVIIIPSILLDYAIARALLTLDDSRHRLRTALFVIGIAANIAFLGYFKYKNFFLDTSNILFATDFALTKTILPLGISFLTFQKIAFLSDVQSGQLKTVPLSDFLLFTLFMPRTVAGPIVHYEEVMPQLSRVELRSLASNLAVGVLLFSIGLFKKTVIADGIAKFALTMSSNPFADTPPGLITAWSGMLAYTFQLYFDFSGYSDMALGVARMFGVRLPMNFNSPFKATSIIDFWSRWHISLTRFLTMYLYTPIVLHLTRQRLLAGKPILRGTRTTLSAMAVLVGWPTVITMTLSGFWHGAGWQFIFWGLLHGIYLTINQCWRMLRPRFWPDGTSYERVMKPVGFVLTFVSVVIALVFFRADSLAESLAVLRGMTGFNGFFSQNIQAIHSAGVPLSWEIFKQLQPPEGLYWIAALFLFVTLFPNSLELLRRFQPSLDFPESVQNADPTTNQTASLLRNRRNSIVRTVHFAQLAINRIRIEGLSLNTTTALYAALAFVLGAMALNRSGQFLYFQF